MSPSRPPLGLLLVLLLGLLAPRQAAAQGVLQSGDIGIVTSDGFWRLRGNNPGGAPVNAVPASAFGLTTLTGPGIEREPGTDGFLICSGAHLFRITILSAATQAITDLTPNLGGTAQLESLDIHPGTGSLFVHDSLSQQVFRFTPPFSAGMVPDLVLPAAGSVRALCVDSRDNPPSVVIATSSVTSRLPLDGSAPIPIALEGGGGLDGDPQTKNRTYITSKNENRIDATTGSPSLVQQLNLVGMCAPVALGPTNVAYNPIDNRAYVFAADGLNPACFAGGSAPNQVVSFPPAQNPGILPVVLTNISNSGITGSNGDLALVLPDFAFPAPYGFAAPSPVSGQAFALDAGSTPFAGNAAFTLELKLGPPLKLVFLLAGVQPLALVLPSGGTVLVAAPITFAIGTTNANGKLTLSAPLGPGLPSGVSAHLQAATVDAGHLILSNGLQLHFAP